MKLAKRFLTVGVALALTLGLNIPAFAATITVTNPAAGETYNAYKLFDVDSNDQKTAYSYSTTDGTLVTALEKIGLTFDVSADGSTYYVKSQQVGETTVFVTGTEEESGTMTAADLASALNNLLESDDYNGELGTPEKGQTNDDDVVITVNDNGYYFVDSSLGSLCILNTADDSVEVKEKNTVPSIDKKVQEDSNKAWQDTATVDTIDTIYYQLTVNTGTNAANLGTGIDGNYTIVDTLPNGVTFNTGTVVINGWSSPDDYTVTEPTTENGNKLTIVLHMEKLKTLAANTDIVITYNAKATTHLTPNMNYTNTAELTYKKQKDSDTATIVTYQIKGDKENNTFTKVDGTNGNAALANVKFALTNAEGHYARFDESGNLTAWEDIDTPAEANKLTTDLNGHIYAYGLDAGTYTLIETDPLPGYNALTDTITVHISEDGTVTYKYTASEDAAGNEIVVVNQTGSQLPTTGGMGTTILYIAGAALVLGAGITLVVRRRMNSDQ